MSAERERGDGMAWAENNYIETRFVKGMNCSVEPHALDRDTGELPDIMNMVCRTQGLRTRKGWLRVSDLSAQYSVLPTNAPSGLFLFEPVLPEEAQEDSEEGGEGGGTPTINPSDLIGGGGSIGGGGGGIKPKPSEKEEEVAPLPSDAWTLAASAGTVMPYVPFDLTITRVSGTASEPRWLQGSLLPTSYKGSYSGDPGSLKHTSTYVWTRKDVMVRNLNRSITGVKYKAGPSSSVHADCQVAYALYSFIPNLPSGVVTGTRFDYTVACVSSGSTVTGYRGGGRGVAFRWKFYDANNNIVSGTASSPSGTWRNGVFSGTCVVSNTDAKRVVLEVEFLGETNTASANIVQATPLLSITVTEQLHIYGGAGVLSIEVTDEYSGTIRPSIQMTAVDSSDESVLFRDWFEDENGNLIDLTQGWTHSGNVWSWSGSIRAKSSRSAETITLLASYKNSETATATIEVLDGLSGELDALSIALNGVAFSLSASVASDSNEGVPRLDVSNIALRRVSGSPSLSSSITTEWAMESTSWDAVYSCTLSGTGDVTIGLYYKDELLTTCEINVMAVLNALVEAINERYQAKGSSTRVTGSDSETTIRNAAVDAISGFAKGSVASNGTFTSFSSSNHGIPAISEEGWDVATYEIVCSAKIKGIATTVYGESGGVFSGYIDEEKVDGEYTDATRRAALSKAKNKVASDFRWSGNQHNGEAYIEAEAYMTDYHQACADLDAARFGLMVTQLPGVSCTITAYGQTAEFNYYVTFNKFGYNIPDKGEYGIMGTWRQPSTGSIVRSGYLGVDISPTFPGGVNYGNFRYQARSINAEYDFKHK